MLQPSVAVKPYMLKLLFAAAEVMRSSSAMSFVQHLHLLPSVKLSDHEKTFA